MAELHLHDLTLWYEFLGDPAAPRLLVFNGSGATIEGSRPLLDRLARSFHVLVHDQRCLGRTSVPDEQPAMADYASDAAALLDHVGWDRTAVFGISFGGMVAQEFAATHPERITRLALLCTSAGGAGGSSYPLHTLADLDPDERERVSVQIVDTRYDDVFLASSPLDRAIVDTMRRRPAAEKSAEQLRGEAMQLEARRHHDVWDRLPRITCPTLVACGAFDGIAPAANSEAIASRIPGAQLRTYEGGHLFVYQDRRAFPDVESFIAG